MTTWIVSANAGRARFFAQENTADSLQEINDMVNAGVRLRTAETESDKIGPLAATKSAHNVGAPVPSSSYEPNQTPTEHQTELFARSVAEYLLRGQQEGRFNKVQLVASPEFLGILRKLLDTNVTAAVSLEINKDYTQSNAKQLQELMQAHEQKS